MFLHESIKYQFSDIIVHTLSKVDCKINTINELYLSYDEYLTIGDGISKISNQKFKDKYNLHENININNNIDDDIEMDDNNNYNSNSLQLDPLSNMIYQWFINQLDKDMQSIQEEEEDNKDIDFANHYLDKNSNVRRLSRRVKNTYKVKLKKKKKNQINGFSSEDSSSDNSDSDYKPNSRRIRKNKSLSRSRSRQGRNSRKRG